jgi:glycerol-3-phosphate dehydrogenase
MARHYARTYGSNSEWILKEASALSDLGKISAMSFMKPS